MRREEFEQKCRKHLRKEGVENFEVWVTMSYTAPGKETEFLTVLTDGNDKTVYFRSAMKLVYSTEFDSEDFCADVLTYLQNGFRVVNLHPKACVCLWEELDEGFIRSYRELEKGEQMLLAYCSEQGIMVEYLEGVCEGYVPDAMLRWKGASISEIEVENAPLIPERMDMGFGFDNGKYQADISELQKEEIAAFIQECHIQAYGKRWTSFSFEFVMQKQQTDGKIELAALVCNDDELAFFKKGEVCIAQNIIPATASISDDFLDYLKDGYGIAYMSVFTHGELWEELAYEEPEKWEKNRQEIQSYMEYCCKQKVTRDSIEQAMECNIPDFMTTWKEMEQKTDHQIKRNGTHFRMKL